MVPATVRPRLLIVHARTLAVCSASLTGTLRVCGPVHVAAQADGQGLNHKRSYGTFSRAELQELEMWAAVEARLEAELAQLAELQAGPAGAQGTKASEAALARQRREVDDIVAEASLQVPKPRIRSSPAC